MTDFSSINGVNQKLGYNFKIEIFAKYFLYEFQYLTVLTIYCFPYSPNKIINVNKAKIKIIRGIQLPNSKEIKQKIRRACKAKTLNIIIPIAEKKAKEK